MTISNSTNKSGPYTGNGATTVFARTFRADDADDIRVYQTVNGLTAEVTTGITKTGIGAESGSVIFDTAPASGVLITILRDIPLTQETDYSAQGSVAPEQVEDDLDRVTMQMQDLAEQVSRSLKAPVTFEGLEAATELLAGQYVKISDDGGSFTGADPQIAVTSIDAWFQARDVASATQAALLPDGSIVVLAGYPYLVDSAATGADSATDDLGVDGLVPFGDRAYLVQFGCAGDGVTDDTANFVRAVRICRTRNIWLDGQWLTYKATVPMTEVPGRIERFKLDGSGITGEIWNATAGSYEAAKTLTADARQDAIDFAATAHGYAAGDVVLVTSTLVMEVSGNSRCAHWGKVQTLPGTNTFKTYEQTVCNLLTANAAQVQRLPAAQVVIRDFEIIGGPAVVNGLVLRRFTDVLVERGYVSDTQARGINCVECYAPVVRDIEGVDCDQSGLGYPVAISGCGWAVVERVTGRRARHVVTFGSSGTIPCIGGSYQDVRGYDCVGSVVDVHAECIDVMQAGGKVVGYFAGMYAGQDGVTVQGVNGSATVKMSGPITRHGCLLQPFHANAAFDRAPSYAVTIKGGDPVQNGVSADLRNCGNIDRIEIEYVGTAGVRGVLIQVGEISIEEISVKGFGIGGIEALEVQMVALSNVRSINIEGEWEGGDLAQPAINILGSTDASTRRTRVTFTKGSATGGEYGIRADNKTDAKVGAAFLDGATAPSVVNGGATVTVLT